VGGFVVGGGRGSVVVVVDGAVVDGAVEDGAVEDGDGLTEEVVVEDGDAVRAAETALAPVPCVVVVVVGLVPVVVVDDPVVPVTGRRVVVVRGALVVARPSVVVARVPRALDSAAADRAGTTVGAGTTVRARPALNTVAGFSAVTAAPAARADRPPIPLGTAVAGAAPSCCATAFTMPSPTGGPVRGRSAAVSAATWD
jgi:hypothetical protein